MAIATANLFPLPAGRSDRAVEPTSSSGQTSADGRWLGAYVILDMVAQVGMFFFGASAVVRLPLRISVYAASLFMLAFTTGRSTRYPSRALMSAIIAILLLQQLNPGGDRPFAQTAQLALYVAVFAPLLWVSRLRIPNAFAAFRRVALALWLFYTASAIMGFLQVRYPGRFDGAVSANYTKESIQPHLFTLADGTKIIRPRGLTDTPGGAAAGGVYSILFGMGLLIANRRIWLRLIAIGGMIAGLFCIYICQGRTNLIIVAISACVLVAVLIRRRAVGSAGALVIVLVAVAAVGTSAAFAIGGNSTVDRFNTLIAEDSGTVVYKNRGKFLDQMLRVDALNYPFGAGMGRWGMMNGYFGGHTQPLWAEMMWQALLYDGGWLLILAYAALLTSVLRLTWKIAVRARSPDLGKWAGVVCGCNVSAVAASFVFPIFSLSMGLEIFLLNACLYLAYREEQQRANQLLPDVVARNMT